MCGCFGPVVSDPSFAAQEAEAAASLVGRYEVDAAKEEVFGAVVRWVTADEGVRGSELDRQLPLVRFLLMKTLEAVMA